MRKRISAFTLAVTMIFTMLISAPLPTGGAVSEYDNNDIAVINGIIDANGLNWTKCDVINDNDLPPDWENVDWSEDTTPKRIIGLDINGLNWPDSDKLKGALDVSGLTALTALNCGFNELEALDVSGLTELGLLVCENNRLTTLDLMDNIELETLFCGNNKLQEIKIDTTVYLASFTGSGQGADYMDEFTAEMHYDGSDPADIKWTGAINLNEKIELYYIEYIHNPITNIDERFVYTYNNELFYSTNELTSKDPSITAPLFRIEAVKLIDSGSGGEETGYLEGTLTLNYDYPITVNYDNNQGTASASKTVAAAGETIDLTANPNPGYQFNGWYVDNGNVTVNNNAFTMPAAPVEITANFGLIPPPL